MVVTSQMTDDEMSICNMIQTNFESKKFPGKCCERCSQAKRVTRAAVQSVQLSSKVCCHRRCTAVQRVFSRCAAQLKLLSPTAA